MPSGRVIVIDIQGRVTSDLCKSLLRSANHAKNRRGRHFYCPDEGLLVVNPDLPVASRALCACVCAPTKERLEDAYTVASTTPFASTILPAAQGMSSCTTQEGVSAVSGGPCARCGGHLLSPRGGGPGKLADVGTALLGGVAGQGQHRSASAPGDEGRHPASHPSPPSTRWKWFAQKAFGGGRKGGNSVYCSGGLLFTGRTQGSTSIVPSSGEARGSHFRREQPVNRSSALATLFSRSWRLTTTGDRAVVTTRMTSCSESR